MSKFHKPKKNPAEGPHYDELARVAVTRALQDCCLKPSDIEQVRKKALGFRLPYSHTRYIYLHVISIPFLFELNLCVFVYFQAVVGNMFAGGGAGQRSLCEC